GFRPVSFGAGGDAGVWGVVRNSGVVGRRESGIGNRESVESHFTFHVSRFKYDLRGPGNRPRACVAIGPSPMAGQDRTGRGAGYAAGALLAPLLYVPASTRNAGRDTDNPGAGSGLPGRGSILYLEERGGEVECGGLGA